MKVLLLPFCFILFQCFSQDTLFQFPVQHNEKNVLLTRSKDLKFKKGHVTYKEDVALSQVIDFLTTPTPPENTVKIDGYRVQIYFNSDKSLVDEQRTKFITEFPRIRTYLHYNAPNYTIKVGNFRSKIQAAKFRSLVSLSFPASIIQDSKIELPSVEEDLIKVSATQ